MPSDSPRLRLASYTTKHMYMEHMQQGNSEYIYRLPRSNRHRDITLSNSADNTSNTYM